MTKTWYIETLTSAGQRDFHVCGQKRPTLRRIAVAVKASGHSAKALGVYRDTYEEGRIVARDEFCAGCMQIKPECRC